MGKPLQTLANFISPMKNFKILHLKTLPLILKDDFEMVDFKLLINLLPETILSLLAFFNCKINCIEA